jgi:hypothetical protein
MKMPIAKPLTVAVALLLANFAMAAGSGVQEVKDVKDSKDVKAPKDVPAKDARLLQLAVQPASVATVKPMAPSSPPTQSNIVATPRYFPRAKLAPGAQPIQGAVAAPVGSGKVALTTKGAKEIKGANDSIYRKTMPDGSVKLSNVPEGDQHEYEQLAIEVPSATSPTLQIPYRVPLVAAATDAPADAQPARLGNESAPQDAPRSDNVGSAGSATYAGLGSYYSRSNTGTNAGSNSISNTGSDIGSHGGAIAGSNTDSSNGGSNTVSNTGSNSVSNGGSNSGSNGGTTMGTNASSTIGSTTAANTGSTTSAPIQWPGSIAPSQVKDPYLASTLPKIGAVLLASGNPAIGRRYLMMDRNTYMYLYGK